MHQVNPAAVAIHFPHILLPRKGIDLGAWAVVACDQYTSHPAYWHDIDCLVGTRPSTLRLIFPEAFLEEPDSQQRIDTINQTMHEYRSSGILEPLEPGVIYVERITAQATLRRGVVVALDLEAYDFSAQATTLIRASEGTVVDRLPPRVKVRRNACLELPHIMVLIDDPQATVVEPLAHAPGTGVYDFDLMTNAGHLSGKLISDPAPLGALITALSNLATPERMKQRYDCADNGVLLYAMGDGNHSFATAKTVWESIKRDTPAGVSLDNHPARFALAEIVNIHDPSLVFEPIHRFIAGVDSHSFTTNLIDWFAGKGATATITTHPDSESALREAATAASRSDQVLAFVNCGQWNSLRITNPPHTLAVGSIQLFLDACASPQSGCKVDYIHGIGALIDLCRAPATAGFVLPSFAKQELFKTMLVDGPLPRKSFSMGEADDKRFYLECRSIDMP